MLFKKKEEAAAESEAQKVEQERIEAVEARRKEILSQKKRSERARQKAAARKAKEEEEARRAIWIDSTQTCTHVQDVIDSVIVTDDKRYLKIIEVIPQNFDMLSVRKQNAVGDSFGGLLNVIPYRVQLKCFSRKGDVEELIAIMRENMAGETNETCRAMQEDYLRLIRDTAHTVGVKRRFFIIMEHKDSAMADGTNFDDTVANLNSFAAMLRSRLLECGNTVLDTGNTDEGVNSILYEILNRRLSETTLFRDHAEEVFNNYELESMKAAENGEEKKTALIAANEFIAPQWMDFMHAHYCVVDNKFYAFYYLDADGYPQPAVVTGWMNFFVNFAEGVDVDIFIDRVPQDKVREKIARNQRFNMTKRQNTESTDMYDMQNRVASGTYMLQAMASQQEYFEVSILVTVSADSLEVLQSNEDFLIKAAKARNLKLRSCLFQQEQAFYSALPLCKLDKTIRSKSWHNMMTEGAASLYPFLSFELQDPKGIMMGTNARNNSLVSIDLFDTARHVNANVAIMGKSGYGKTFTAQLLAVRERLQGIQVFIITPLKGREDYKRTCDKIQGQYLAMGPGTPYSINIFDITAPDETAMEEGYVAKSLLAQKVASLHTFIHLICKDITYEEEMRMDGFFYEAYRRKGITDDNESIYIPGTKQYKEMPLLEDVYELLKNEPGMTRMVHLLTPYVSGAHKEFNRHTNVNLDNLYICFDMDGLNGDDLAVALFVALDFVWRKIKENKAVKKSVFIDEIWKLIGIEGNDMAANYCVEIFKTIRAYGGSAVSMTQEVTDFFKLKNGAYGKGIISAADTKICLRLDEGELAKLQDVMELSESELEHIPNLQRGTGILVTGNARVEVKFTASEKEKYVISTDPELARKEQAERLARIRALSELQGETKPDADTSDADNMADAVDSENSDFSE